MPPAALPTNEAARLRALLECHVLDTAPEAAFDDLTALAARLCETPIALVSLLDESRQWFKSSVGLEAKETHRDLAFCAHAILHDAPLIIPDATQDERTRDNALVTGDPGIRFYAGIPLCTNDGLALGTLCVIDTKPRKIAGQQLADLRALARQAASQLELRRNLHQLRIAKEQADSANETKSSFLANMSHEIRTPLTAVLGFSEELEDAVTDADGREALGAIQRNGRHLLNLINELLDLSKIEAGMMTVERLSHDVSSAVHDVRELAAALANEHDVLFTIDFDGEIPERIETDPTRLRQILTNVLSNAIKFARGGTVKLIITFDDSGQHPRIRFDVIDDGIGMTPEQVDKLFRPFTQADVSTTRNFGGTGLGLTICKRFARLLGGDLVLVSTVDGGGSHFRASVGTGCIDRVPFIRPNLNELAERERHLRDEPTGLPDLLGGDLLASAAATPPQPLAGLRILLAEDSPDNQRLLMMILKKSGATVTLAENGKIAFDAATAAAAGGEPFDCILMDMQMPVWDGYQAASELRSAGSDAPIVALTANPMDEERQQCLSAGCCDFAAKPIDRTALIETIQRHASKPAALAT